MSIAATYVSTTSFTVGTDLTADFVPGRALLLDCGVDGDKYGYVSYSSYSSPNTTVHLDATDSQALTENLANVDFSVFKYQRVSGNNPLEMLWMTRGMQTISMAYKDADEISLRPGVVHINDGTTEALYQCPGFDKQLTSLSASTWYFIYAKAPTNGRVLSATEIEYATTVPSLVAAKQGYYHPSNAGWRCIGFVRADGTSAVSKFAVSGAKYILDVDYWITDANGTTPSNTWTDVVISVPLPGMVASLKLVGEYANAALPYMVRPNGSASAGQAIVYVSSSTSVAFSFLDIPTDANKIIEHRFSSATTNKAYVVLTGFYFPQEILSAGSGGGASASPLYGMALHGHKSGLTLSYKDADEFYVAGGVLHINNGSGDLILEATSQLTKAVTGLSAATWYAVYVDPPDSGTTLAAADIEYSATMPTWDHAKAGWYHPSTTDLRCIGFVRTDGSSNLVPFQTSGRECIFSTAFTDVNSVAPSTTWTTGTLTVPIGDIYGLCTVISLYVDTETGLQVRRKGATTGYSLVTAASASKWSSTEARIMLDSSKQFEFSFAAATTNQAFFFTHGFVLPAGF